MIAMNFLYYRIFLKNETWCWQYILLHNTDSDKTKKNCFKIKYMYILKEKKVTCRNLFYWTFLQIKKLLF